MFHELHERIDRPRRFAYQNNLTSALVFGALPFSLVLSFLLQLQPQDPADVLAVSLVAFSAVLLTLYVSFTTDLLKAEARLALWHPRLFLAMRHREWRAAMLQIAQRFAREASECPGFTMKLRGNPSTVEGRHFLIGLGFSHAFLTRLGDAEVTFYVRTQGPLSNHDMLLLTRDGTHPKVTTTGLIEP